MNELKAIKSSGVLPPPPLSFPPRTSFFLRSEGNIRSTLDYFSSKATQAYRDDCLNTIVKDGGKHLLALLTNVDKNAPVNFFEGAYGGHVNMAALTFLESQARMIAGAGGSFWPMFFCDENENAVIRNASLETHQRAFGLLIAHLRPYVPGFIIGIESSEYFTKDQHNGFVALIRHFAPDRYVGIHTQSVPKGGVPDVDFVAWEAPWSPDRGDEFTAQQLVSEAKKAQKEFNRYLWPVEYNLNVGSARQREQGRVLLQAGFGAGGPV